MVIIIKIIIHPQISSDDDRDSIRRDIWCLWDPRWRQQLLIYIDLAPTSTIRQTSEIDKRGKTKIVETII